MVVLSLFDGMSAGQIALKRINVNVEKYYASEIDKHCINLTKRHFPKTIQLGAVENWEAWDIDWSTIDLLIGGSPCQGFSFSGKQLNFEDPRSKLFFKFVDILNHIKQFNPDVKFMLENVSMKMVYEDTITDFLGVKPYKINSSLVSAQNRERLYWVNFKINPIKDRNINLLDILDKTNDGYYNKATIVGRRLNKYGKREDYNKNIPISQCLEVRNSNTNKSNCLTTVDKDNVLTSLSVGRYPDAFKNKLPFRYYSLKETCRLQTVSEDYFDDIVSERQARKMLGNGWTVDLIVEILMNAVRLSTND